MKKNTIFPRKEMKARIKGRDHSIKEEESECD